MLAARAFSHIHRDQTAEEICARAFPADDKAQWLTKASVSPDSTTGSASVLAVTTTNPLLLVAPGSAAAQLFQECLRLDLGGLAAISVPHVSTHPVPIWVAEGGPTPVVQPGVGKTTLGPTRKLSFIVALTRELHESTPETGAVVLGRLLDEAAAKSLDAYAFDNVAADATRPAGLLNGVTPLVSTVAGTGISAAAGDVSKLAGAMSDAAINPQNMILIMHPVEAWNLMMLRGFERLPAQLLQSPAIPRGTVIGVAPAAIATAYGGDPEVEVSANAGALHMEDTTPPQLATGGVMASPTRSVWQTDSLVVKVRMRAAWASLQPGAVQFLQSVNW